MDQQLAELNIVHLGNFQYLILARGLHNEEVSLIMSGAQIRGFYEKFEVLETEIQDQLRIIQHFDAD